MWPCRFTAKRSHSVSASTARSTVSRNFRVRPGNVPEDRHARVRSGILDHPRQQREVIILREKYRRFGSLHFLQDCVRKAAIYFLILQPVLRTKDGTRVRIVRERPQSFIRKTFVIAFVLFVAEPHAAQRVTWMIGRNAQVIALDHPS